MAKAAIDVLLGGGEEQVGVNHYRPGGELWGMVQVVPDGNVRCNHLWVRLQWHTEGRGTRDEGKVAELDVFQGELRGGSALSREFRFALPYDPWSYAGRYVSIVWEIAVDVDVPWSVNPRFSHPFVMTPERAKLAAAVFSGSEPASGAAIAPETAGFDVTLVSYGNNLIEVGKVVLELMPYLGTLQASKLVVEAPVLLMRGVPEATAQNARAKLEASGAAVEVKPTSRA